MWTHKNYGPVIPSVSYLFSLKESSLQSGSLILVKTTKALNNDFINEKSFKYWWRFYIFILELLCYNFESTPIPVKMSFFKKVLIIKLNIV